MSNHETALKAEMKRVVRCWQGYSSEQRASNAANFRMGHQQRRSFGEYFYVHPDIPKIAFSKRKRAAEAGMALAVSRPNHSTPEK